MKPKTNMLVRTICIAFTAATSFVATSSCSKIDLINEVASTTASNKNQHRNLLVDTTLRDILPFKIGAAINMNRLANVAYKAAAIREFNSVTGEAVMKMKALQPSQGTFTFTNADSLVRFAEANGMRIHGHTLVWDNVPAWVTAYSGTTAQWDTLMKTHIKTVVSHFKGKVASWDVVNEAIDDNGNLKSNIWLTNIGPDYIAKAFQYAHEADTAAKLFYNDYGQEYSNKRRKGINTMIRGLLAAGIPVHGVGMQMHMLKGQSTAGIKAAIDSSAATGLLVHISEIDISLNTPPSMTYAVTPSDWAIQCNLYEYVANTYVHNVPVANQFGITTWSVGDKDSWRRHTTSPSHADWPVLLNDDYAHKQCYGRFVYGALN